MQNSNYYYTIELKIYVGLAHHNDLYIGTKNISKSFNCTYIDTVLNPKIDQNTESTIIDQSVNNVLSQIFNNLDLENKFKHITQDTYYSKHDILSWIINNYFGLCNALRAEHDSAFYLYINNHYLNEITKYWLSNLPLIKLKYNKNQKIMDYICGPYACSVHNLDRRITNIGDINVLLSELTQIVLNSKSHFVSAHLIGALLLLETKVNTVIPCSWLGIALDAIDNIYKNTKNHPTEMKAIKSLITFSITNESDLAKMTDFILKSPNDNRLSFEQLIAIGFSFSVDDKNLANVRHINQHLIALAQLSGHSARIDVALHRLNVMFDLEN